MALRDLARCARLEIELFTEDGPWSESALRSELAAPHNRYVVVHGDDGEVLGYAGIGLLGSGEGAESEIHTIGVAPAAQRRGIGAALLRELLRYADEHGGPVFLEVRTGNDAAIELYRRAGFEVVGTRKNYYQPSGADAFTMRRAAAGTETTA